MADEIPGAGARWTERDEGGWEEYYAVDTAQEVWQKSRDMVRWQDEVVSGVVWRIGAEHPESMDPHAVPDADRWMRPTMAERAASHNARAAAMGATGSFSQKDWLSLLRIHNYQCPYCCGPNGVTLDHVIALARRGSNWIWNITPACAPCNFSKNARPLDDWALSKGYDPARIWRRLETAWGLLREEKDREAAYV